MREPLSGNRPPSNRLGDLHLVDKFSAVAGAGPYVVAAGGTGKFTDKCLGDGLQREGIFTNIPGHTGCTRFLETEFSRTAHLHLFPYRTRVGSFHTGADEFGLW
jgi:hypothetical protein